MEHFVREVGWREFSYHLLNNFPFLTNKPLRPEFENFPWSPNKKYLESWKKGMTGYPIVDAGMRELWSTGWMHNRVRMIVASFLVKHLLLDWKEGADWFWDTLVDADLASNTSGWQWTAGCGADAAPYFRVFNPILQGKRFDSNGDYVRKWVPEISKLPNEKIHTHWEVSEDELQNLVDSSSSADADVEVYQGVSFEATDENGDPIELSEGATLDIEMTFDPTRDEFDLGFITEDGEIVALGANCIDNLDGTWTCSGDGPGFGSYIVYSYDPTSSVGGCTLMAACNYNDQATINDGSCQYDPEPILGCMDSEANNYNSDATEDDGSCEYDPDPDEPVPGCMDPEASNYDSNATEEDGSCEYEKSE